MMMMIISIFKGPMGAAVLFSGHWGRSIIGVGHDRVCRGSSSRGLFLICLGEKVKGQGHSVKKCKNI